VHSALRTFADELGATLSRVLAYLSGLALIVVFCIQLVEPAAEAVPTEPVAPPDWSSVDRPYHAFGLALGDADEAAPRYLIRRHAAGGGRKDIIGWGDAASLTAAGMVEIYRPGTELAGFADAPTEIAARTADLGTVEKVTLLGTMDTKFGPMSLVDFSSRVGTTPRSCLGFVRIFDEPRLQIAGWYCNGGPEIVDRGQLACALDRLTLIAAGGEPKVVELFARAEIKRTFCGKKSPILAATVRRPDWIDASVDPKLRGGVGGR
jgi:hypothetical protein